MRSHRRRRTAGHLLGHIRLRYDVRHDHIHTSFLCDLLCFWVPEFPYPFPARRTSSGRVSHLHRTPSVLSYDTVYCTSPVDLHRPLLLTGDRRLDAPRRDRALRPTGKLAPGDGRRETAATLTALPRNLGTLLHCCYVVALPSPGSRVQETAYRCTVHGASSTGAASRVIESPVWPGAFFGRPLRPSVPRAHCPSQPRNAPVGLGVGQGTKGKGHSEDVGCAESERRRLGARPACGSQPSSLRTDLSVRLSVYLVLFWFSCLFGPCLSVSTSSSPSSACAQCADDPSFLNRYRRRPRSRRLLFRWRARQAPSPPIRPERWVRGRSACASAGVLRCTLGSPGRLQHRCQRGVVRLTSSPGARSRQEVLGSCRVTVSPRCRRMRDFLSCLRVARRKSTRGRQRR